jgi:hypothetical protein
MDTFSAGWHSLRQMTHDSVRVQAPAPNGTSRLAKVVPNCGSWPSGSNALSGVGVPGCYVPSNVRNRCVLLRGAAAVGVSLARSVSLRR